MIKAMVFDLSLSSSYDSKSLGHLVIPGQCFKILVQFVPEKCSFFTADFQLVLHVSNIYILQKIIVNYHLKCKDT